MKPIGTLELAEAVLRFEVVGGFEAKAALLGQGLCPRAAEEGVRGAGEHRLCRQNGVPDPVR